MVRVSYIWVVTRVVKVAAKMYLRYSYTYSYEKVPRYIPRYSLKNVPALKM